MNYQHIAHLAELADQLSDKTNIGERFDMSVEFDVLDDAPRVQVILHSWHQKYDGGLSVYRIETRAYPPKRDYTVEEIIQVVEQIKHYGFRMEDAA